MKKKITEETVIFASVVKWVLLATVVGIFTGIASSGFVRLLDYSISFQAGFPYYYMFLPLILPCVAYLSIKVFPYSLDYTTDKVISVIHGGRKISLVSIIKAFFLSIISVYGHRATMISFSGLLAMSLAFGHIQEIGV